MKIQKGEVLINSHFNNPMQVTMQLECNVNTKLVNALIFKITHFSGSTHVPFYHPLQVPKTKLSMKQEAHTVFHEDISLWIVSLFELIHSSILLLTMDTTGLP